MSTLFCVKTQNHLMRSMKPEQQELKLFKVTGGYIRDFYLVGRDANEVAHDARKILGIFRITECPVEDNGWFAGFKRQLRIK